MTRLALGFLFVPGSRHERILKAISSGADAVIVDLEDAVPLQEKANARASLAANWETYAQTACSNGVTLLLRINPDNTEWHVNDLIMARDAGVEHIVVPKAESGAALASVNRAVPNASLYPLLETALGFDQIRNVARGPGVARLMLGAVDLMLDLGVRSDGEPLHYYRSRVVQHSCLAQLPAPVDGVCVALDDPAQMAFECRRARDFGFGGKLLIHPKQVAQALAEFAPTAQEIDWACRVVAACADAPGAAVAVDGKMVDKPVLLQAERLLALAGRGAGTPGDSFA